MERWDVAHGNAANAECRPAPPGAAPTTENGRGSRAFLPLVSRRGFLRGAGLLVAGIAAEAGASCGEGGREPALSPNASPVPEDQKYPDVPAAPSSPAEADGKLRFFQPDEAQTLDALTARILPGDANDPGAHEIGVLYFIDNVLATTTANHGWPEPHYSSGPFASPYEGPSPPGPNTADVIYVPKSELSRYGYQSKLTPQQVFRQGLSQLDAYAKGKHGQNFAALSANDQDSVIGDLANGTITGFDDPNADTFWSMLYDHTVQGIFSDPLYGGNRNFAGWKLVGYPGAQRAYTPHDIKTGGTTLPFQGLCQLPPLAPGEPAEQSVIHPVSGSYQYPGNQPVPQQFSGNGNR